MVAINQLGLRQWLAFGSGVGIEIRGADLEVALVRVWPRGVRLSGVCHIENFRERPAAEWGAEYATFLRSHDAGRARALLLLERDAAIVRQLSLPGVGAADVPAAIRFQLDGLHPFAEDAIIADWQVAPDAGFWLTAIAERGKMADYGALFAEAGIRLVGATPPPAAYQRAVRVLGAPPPDGFLAVKGLACEASENIEIYAEGPGRGCFSALLDAAPAAAAAIARAELRLAPETEPLDLADLLPRATAGDAALDLSPQAISGRAGAYAAALAGACPHLGPTLNLLPEEFRAAPGRLVYAPTAALAGLLLLAAAGLLLQGSWQDRRYLALIHAEAAKVTPQARRVEQLDRQTEAALGRIHELDGFRSRTKADLDLLLELTRLIPEKDVVSALEMNRSSVALTGAGEKAEELLKTLDASPLLEKSEFGMPITRSGGQEIFRIRALREGGAR
jgi:hypothetical protein